MDLREQLFGIEIEMTGITREKAAEVISEYFGTQSRYVGTYYNTYEAKDNENRIWKLTYDGSIHCQKKINGRKTTADRDYSTELVSPILKYKDLETVQEIIRKLRENGAFPNTSCGIHIHVNAHFFDTKRLRNLVNIVSAKEDIIYKALQVDTTREQRYCQKTDTNFLEKLNHNKPRTMEEFKAIWYNGDDGSGEHYHRSRYRCLNLHSVFQKGTIEFRAFNSFENADKMFFHAGKIKAYIQFCLAITAQAYNQNSARVTRTQSTNEKYTFRVWLLRLGMIGDEFKTVRTHLLNHLTGNIAWKDPQQAEKQKERLMAKKALELEKAQSLVITEETDSENMPCSSEQEQEEAYSFVMSM